MLWSSEDSIKTLDRLYPRSADRIVGHEQLSVEVAGINIASMCNDQSKLLGISDLLQRKPARLSGGERQRVALGRALSFEPDVLLLDEPLSALDDDTRYQMYEVIHRVRKHTNVTTLHVTHNRDEATELADAIFQMSDGRVCAVDHA